VKLLRSIVLSFVCCSLAQAATLHTDDFQSGPDIDWFGGSSPTYVATGGPAGDGDAFLQISAPSDNNLATYNPDARWTGSFTAIGAVAVTVDMMAPPLPAGDFDNSSVVDANDLDDPTKGWKTRFGADLDGSNFLAWQRDLGQSGGSIALPVRLVVMGPSSINIHWASVNPQLVPNDGVWRHYTFSMAASDLVLTTPFVSASYTDLMSSVSRIMLRYDPGDPTDRGSGVQGPRGVLNLDNIRLAGAGSASSAALAIPEPSSVLLSFLGLLGVLAGSRYGLTQLFFRGRRPGPAGS
jgi:hypothetical protein